MMKHRGTLDRYRFTLKLPDGTLERYGCCDPKIDSGRNIIESFGSHWLVQRHIGEEHPPVWPTRIMEGTTVANGYYDHEHDEFVPVAEFLRKA
jgi:hypothetical protein